jgi:hypothetical protein
MGPERVQEERESGIGRDETEELVTLVRQLIRENRKFLERLDEEGDVEGAPGEGEDDEPPPLPSV